MSFVNRNLFLFFMLASIGLLLQYIYTNIVYALISMHIFRVLEVSAFSLLYFIFGILIALVLLPKRLEKPSDFFIFLYIMLFLLPKVAFINIFVVFTPVEHIALLALMVIPVILVLVLLRLKTPRLPLKQLGLFDRYWYVTPFFLGFLASLIALCILFQNFLSFDLATHYDRRFFFEDYLQDKILLSYAFTIFTYGLTPFAAFIAVRRKKVLMLIPALVFPFIMFGLTGEKFQFMLVGTSIALGLYTVNQRRLSGISVPLGLSLILAVLILTVLIFWFNDNYFLAFYVVRRMFMLPAYIIEVYLQYFIISDFSFIYGTEGSGSIAYKISSEMLGTPSVKANTSFIVIAFANGGIIELLGIIFMLYIWLLIANSMFKRSNNSNWLWVGFMIGAISFNQKLTILFLSSGIGLLSIFFFLEYIVEKSKNFKTSHDELVRVNSGK